MKCFKVTGAKPIVSFCFFTKSCLFLLKHDLQGSRFLLSGMFNIFVLVEMWSLPRGKKELHELLKLILMWDFFFFLIKQLAQTLLTKLTNLPFLAGETFSMIKALN